MLTMFSTLVRTSRGTQSSTILHEESSDRREAGSKKADLHGAGRTLERDDGAARWLRSNNAATGSSTSTSGLATAGRARGKGQSRADNTRAQGADDWQSAGAPRNHNWS